MKRTVSIVAGLLVALMVAVVAAGPWAYKTYLEGPPAPALSLPGTTAPASVGVDGTWTVQPGSQAGYRVQQQLLWEMVDVTGRTDAVSGTVQIADAHTRSIEFTIDVDTVTSGKPGRDEKFRGTDVLDTAQFPTATLTSNVPVDLAAVPDNGTPAHLEVPAQVTLRGVTQPATAMIDIQRNGDAVDVAGTVPIRHFDFNVDPPKPFASLLEVQPVATIEFLVRLAKE